MASYIGLKRKGYFAIQQRHRFSSERRRKVTQSISNNNVSISGPSAEVSPSAVKAAEARARSRAVSNAVTEAKGQLKASGVARLGKLLTVAPTDQGGYSSRGMMLESVSARSAAPVMPEFTSPNKQTVNQTINATFAIKGPGLMARLRGMVGRK